MRPLLVTTDFSPAPTGGIGVHVAGLVGGLMGLGVAADVVTTSPGDRRPGVIRSGSTGPEALTSGRPLTYLLWELQNSVAMAADAAVECRPDLVHCHDFRSAWAAAALAKAFHCPFVVTKHTLHPLISPYGEITESRDIFFSYIREMERWLYAACDGVIAISECVMESLEAYGIPGVIEKATTISNGTDLVSSPEPPMPFEESRRLRVLFAGRLTDVKGVDIIGETFTELSDLDVEFAIAGSGPMGSVLERSATAAGMAERVEMLGSISHASMEKFYRSGDILLVPSRHDGFPIAVCEGQAMGRLVIGSATGGIVDQIEDGVTGLLVKPADARSLSSAIRWACDNVDEARSIARAARRHAVRTYSWEKIASKTLNVYHRVLGC